MNREIKFRGKAVYDKVWVFGNLRISGRQAYIADLDSPAQSEVKSDTVGEYTGLDDSKGNGIYEGDFVRVDYAPICSFATPRFGEVIMKDGCWSIKYWFEPFRCQCYMNLFKAEDPICKIEVIGNVFDNPELLKHE